jgi:hypothetical protein
MGNIVVKQKEIIRDRKPLKQDKALTQNAPRPAFQQKSPTQMLADMPLRQVFQDGVNYAREHGDDEPHYDADKIQKAFEASKDRYLNGWGK